jgi:GntR family transcriptional regulator
MSELKTMYARSRIPLYIQVAFALRQRIETGQWLPGQKISTLEELEREFEVARVTVRQAVELLQDEGLVLRQQGRGTFVADKLQDKRWLRLETTWQSLVTPIKDNVLRIIKVDDPPARPRLTEGEGKFAKEYVYLRSLQLKDGAPYSLVNLHLDRAIYDRNPKSFLTHSALPILATLKAAEIESAHQTLVIGNADPGTASLLQVPLGAPTAECHCVVTNRKGVAIYVAEIIYRNDCVKLYIELLDGSKSRGHAAGSGTSPGPAKASRAVSPGRSRDKAARSGKVH